jgi:glutathione synthase
MDPLSGLQIKKDSTLAMIAAAQARGWQVWVMETRDLFIRDGQCFTRATPIRLTLTEKPWYQAGTAEVFALHTLDAVLMRKDPPFDTDYIYSTYLLEMAESAGTLVVNHPQSLRDCNEKLFAVQFPACCPPLVVSSQAAVIREFLTDQGDIVVKPLHGMGGQSIFRIRADDPNISVIIETLTDHGRTLTMAQRYLPEIRAGDKRILMIDGEPVSHALARIPGAGETRGNLAAGGTGEAIPLSERDRWICAQVGPELRRRGLLFVGLDVIGDYLTEINVTSPTCIRELDAQCGLDIGGQLMDCLAAKLEQHSR